MSKSDLLKQLPAVHELIQEISSQVSGKSQHEIKRAVQFAIDDWRTKILREDSIDLKADLFSLIKEKALDNIMNPSGIIRPVINATGVVIHTNLGRSRLSKKAVQKMMEVANMYSNLEYDLKKGERGSRHDLIEETIIKITGAEAAMVVNNNAAAVYFVLKTFAKDKEVIVSRGELVEIGGSFRISSIMKESGALLKEVGTTNKTHLKDYVGSITEHTAMIMKVHTSNFKMIGFTKDVPSKDLISLKKTHPDLIIYEDLGSGALFPFKEIGIGDEPLVSDVIGQGVDLVTFSGDKLLGGPQAGIIAGKKDYIDLLKKNQLARVLRVDKITIAALSETLLAYLNEELEEIPTVRDILKKADDIKKRVRLMINQIGNHPSITCRVVEEYSRIGGGTMPDVKLKTFCLGITYKQGPEYVARVFRRNKIPIIVRIKDDEVLLDFRTVSQEEESILIDAIRSIDS